MSDTRQYKAYLRIRAYGTRKVVDSLGLNDLSERHVERVMSGLLRQMNTDDYFVDESEVDAERTREQRG